MLLVMAATVAAVGYELHFTKTHLGKTVLIDTSGQPTIGYPKALVHVVVFEEPKCSDCKEYNNHILPKIKTQFIDTNKILYTVIPVSFLPHSMPAALFLECIYHQNPAYPNDDLFFKVLDQLYLDQPDEHTDWATEDYLMAFAKKFPEIDDQKLKGCIDKQTYYNLIQKNTTDAKKTMGGVVTTPSIYVDGAKVETVSLKDVSDKITLALSLKGVSS